MKLRFCIIRTPFHYIVLHFQVDYGICEVQPKENSYIIRFFQIIALYKTENVSDSYIRCKQECWIKKINPDLKSAEEKLTGKKKRQTKLFLVNQNVNMLILKTSADVLKLMLHDTHLPMTFPVKQVLIHQKVQSLLKCMNYNSFIAFHGLSSCCSD